MAVLSNRGEKSKFADILNSLVLTCPRCLYSVHIPEPVPSLFLVLLQAKLCPSVWTTLSSSSVPDVLWICQVSPPFQRVRINTVQKKGFINWLLWLGAQAFCNGYLSTRELRKSVGVQPKILETWAQERQ